MQFGAMTAENGQGREILGSGEGKTGTTAAFPYDRMTVERFRVAFPRARWRDDLRAWFVPGKTAERRVSRWLERELQGTLGYADEKGRDAFTFEPIESPYLVPGEDLAIRTPYSRTIVAELREVPWAWWDAEAKAWRVPFRSVEALRRRWPAIEAAARRNEPDEKRRRREARKGSLADVEVRARGDERRRRRYPVPAEAMPSLGRVVMTRGYGAVIFTDITGELVEDNVHDRYYADVAGTSDALIWARWRKPTHHELVKTWPARQPPGDADLLRGWWQPTLTQLREERRKAASAERALAARRAKRPA